MSNGSDMHVFSVVVTAGSFAGAAKTLGMTPSGVSRRIGRLEERLGVRLLNRTTRQLSMTDAGDRYNQRAGQILADIEEAEREASESQAAPRGRLRITAGMTYGFHRLMPLVPDFLMEYPEVEIDLILLDRMVDLVGEGFDIAFRTGEAQDSSLMARRLPDTEFVTCASPEYLARNGTPQVPSDLTKHNCLVHLLTSRRLDKWRFKGAGGTKVVDVSGTMSSSNPDMLMRSAIRHLGIVHLSRIPAENALADGRLVPILTEYEGEDVLPVRMLYPSARQLSPKVRAFIDFTVEHWGETD
ncbi:MAG: LysR family transcriptional regulator [Pseudomonadota bacterium]